MLPIAHADTLGWRVRGTVTIGPILAIDVCSAASVMATNGSIHIVCESPTDSSPKPACSATRAHSATSSSRRIGRPAPIVRPRAFWLRSRIVGDGINRVDPHSVARQVLDHWCHVAAFPCRLALEPLQQGVLVLDDRYAEGGLLFR